MDALQKQIRDYTPYNEQESVDRLAILDFIQNNDNALLRDNKIAHMTASAWVVNRDMDKVLMAYQNIYDSWAWMGGHADGDSDMLHVAIKEVMEECGLDAVTPVKNDIYSLETIHVEGHIKNGKYVSSHLHLNITYLLMADDSRELFIKENENSDVAWFDLETAIHMCSEPWIAKNIYMKLNANLKAIKATKQ